MRRAPRGERAYSNITVKGMQKGVAKRKEDLALIAATMRAERMVRPVNNSALLGLMRKQALQSTTGPEIKWVDVPSATANFRASGTPPAAISLFTPLQGAAGFNRIGQKVILKSLRVRGYVQAGATSTPDFGRIIVVYDKQANAALPNWADLITSISAAGAATTDTLAGINMSNRNRFIVLADEQLWLPSVTYTAGVLTNVGSLNTTDKNPSMFNFDRFIKLRDMETHFNNANGGTFADIQTGSLNMFLVSGNDAKYFMTYNARVRFADA